MSNWIDYYNEALDFLSGAGHKNAYSELCTDISKSRDGEQVLGHWGIAAGIYVTVKCLFD